MAGGGKEYVCGWPQNEARFALQYTNDVRTRILRNVQVEQQQIPFVSMI